MSKSLDELVKIVAQLRAPGGCPWDIEQTHESIIPDMLDEVYEFFESIDEKNPEHMREELGDVLLQIVFHSQIESEKSTFTFDDVAAEISEKLIRRHPHVFGNETVADTEEVLKNWEQIKKSEKGKEDRLYITDGVPKNLPALVRAEKLGKKVKRYGFEWAEVSSALDKVEEEFAEFRVALEAGDMENAHEELGDILFSLVNVARYEKISAEEALRHTTNKFIKRFNYIEESYGFDGEAMKSATLEELDARWDEAKQKG